MENTYLGPPCNVTQGADQGVRWRPPKDLLNAQTQKSELTSVVQMQLSQKPSGNLDARFRKGGERSLQDINADEKLNKNHIQKTVKEVFRLEANNGKTQILAAEVLDKRNPLRQSSKNVQICAPPACQMRSEQVKQPAPVAITFEPNESKFCKVVQHSQIGNKESLDPTLAALKRIYGQVLPGMRDETRRILRNWDYTSIVATGQQVMGGCTFKYHRDESFIELTLLGVAWSCQEYGLGSSIIESLKLHASVKDFANIVTYADNNAITFFKKQGFQALEPTHESFEVVKNTIVPCVASTLMYVAVPLKAQPTVTETIRQLPNNTLLEIKPMALPTIDCLLEAINNQETSLQMLSQQMNRELSHCRNTIDRQAFENKKTQVFLLQSPGLKIKENSAEEARLKDEQDLDQLLLSPEQPSSPKALDQTKQSVVKISSVSELVNKHSVFFTRERICRTAMKQPLMVSTDQQDEQENDEILASPFGFYDEYIDESKVSLSLHDADEIYPSDLDMFPEQQAATPHFVKLPSGQIDSPPDFEPMFPYQDVRTEVFLNEPNFAKYRKVIKQDRTTNLNSSFILGAEIDGSDQRQGLSKEQISIQYLKSIQNVVLPRSETFKNDFIVNFDSSSPTQSKEVVFETPKRRNVVEDLESLPVAIQRQRQDYFKQLQTRCITVDVSSELKRSKQFSSFYEENEVSGEKELKIQRKECDFLDLDRELLGDSHQDVEKTVTARPTNMPQVRSINELLENRLVRHDADKVKNDYVRQNSKNTLNSLTTSMGTTSENTELQPAPAVADSKLDFKDIKIFKTIVFDIFIQHENKLKELTRPSLADCFLVCWSKKALITAESNTEQKVANLINMCRKQPILCSCIGSAAKQLDLEPSFDLWRQPDVKTCSNL